MLDQLGVGLRDGREGGREGAVDLVVREPSISRQRFRNGGFFPMILLSPAREEMLHDFLSFV